MSEKKHAISEAIGLRPELRFPEFEKDGGWSKKELNDICEITNGKANAQDHIEEGLYPLFDRSEVIKSTNNYIFDCEAVIIPGEGMRFVPKYYEGKFNLHQRAYALKDFSCIGRFAYYSMFHRSNLISQKAVQSTVLSLRLPILQRFPIEIPSNHNEQQKIASCLSSLDELISAHREKLEALQAHKKGLMQNLFPQEGQTVPNYRFPEFEDDGEWVEKKLGDLLEFKNGINASKEQYGKGIKFINVMDILKNEFITYDKIIGSVDVSEEIAEKFSVNYGDILFQRSSETQEEVGTANVYIDNKKTATFGGFVIRGKKIGHYDPIFLNALLKTKEVRDSISSRAGGSTRYNVGQEVLSSTKILSPFIEEQQKIAFCLSAVDELITAQAEKFMQLQQHKKGLMQGLFPKIGK